MYLICPKTSEAKQWILDNCYTEPWQWLGNNLAVDRHYIEDIAYGMKEDGLTAEDMEVIRA